MSKKRILTILWYLTLIIFGTLIGSTIITEKIEHEHLHIQQTQPTGEFRLVPYSSVTRSAESYGPHLSEGLWLYGTASWYDQTPLIQSRKDIAGDDFGTAARIYPLGTVIRACHTNNARCVALVVNDFCEACSNTYPDRVLDIQKEAFEELSEGNLGAGVLRIRYYIK